MDVCVTPRRHNPVDSICRKLQTIQRWDRKADSPFQIPKLQSSSYDSPHLGLRCNLETILKKRTLRSENDPHPDAGPALPGAVAPAGSPAPRPPTHPGTPAMPATPANATYTITSTLGSLSERHGTGAGQSRAWQRTCSTPAAQGGEGYFTFARYPGHSQPDGGGTDSQQPRNPSHSLLSYNLKFCSTNSTTLLDTELAYPALVVKRLSMGDGGVFPSEPKKESMAEVSLICEEDLLDTIFQACDTQRRGKVYVSRIVDYLRHTTSRSSEDSGLEELCNMLDPEHKDISIDLDTYHAIMKEWIDDCRKQREDVQEDSIQGSVKRHDSLSAKRSALLSMTSGSLEAFGGEASRADLETSDLVYCVADLQFSNQKLQEEVRKLKQAVDTMEEINQRLLEENEELKTQAKVAQQLAQREKLLKEEVEEMKLSLSNLAESQALATSQSKQMERENQGLITKIACLQEESIKSAMEVDDFQRRMIELCDLNTDLQVQAHSFDTVIAEKQGVIQEKNRQIEELKAAIMEYSSVTERLRADKTRLESQMQLLHPDSTLAGLSLSVAYRLNQTSSGSLQTELALAQSPLEGPERLSYVTSPLDETLDREVLLLLQGPMPEQMAQEFKTRLHRLRTELQEDTLAVLAALRGLLSTPGGPEGSMEPALQDLQARLEQGRGEWAHSLERMEQYTDSLEKELLKMASNMRRAHTDILHLSVRVQEQENHRQQLYEELERLKTPQDSREASCQTPDNQHQALGELDAPSLDWDDGCITSRLEQEPEVKLQSGLSTGVEEVREHQEQTPDWLKEDADPSLIADRVVEGRSSDGVISQEDSGVWKEDIGGDSTLSQESLPDRNPHHEAADAGVVRVEKPTENDRIPLEDSRLPGCTAAQAAHEHAVQGGGSQPSPHPHAHTLCADKLTLNPVWAQPELLPQVPEAPSTDPGASTDPPTNPEMVSPSSCPPSLSQTISPPARTSEPATAERGPEGKQDAPASECHPQMHSLELRSDPSSALDRVALLPVAEEEESVPEAAQADKQSDQGSKKDSLTPKAKSKKELDLPQGMEAIKENKTQEDSEVSSVTEREVSEDTSDSTKDDRNGPSPNDKEIEAEFHRLSLGFKCDMFTLEKRLRLEERSRDLAEENVRKEVSSCLGLLQALIPRCEEDGLCMEIIQRLQKNLEILMQSMTRVSSRSEMLGAIHQESRTGKAVEVMVHHVENLKRMYTKEHTELTELRESIAQTEKSFGSTERDDFRTKKPPGSQYYKVQSAVRRVSIATMPRSGGGNMNHDPAKDSLETEAERLSRKSPWTMMAKGSQRPQLKRFISSGAWPADEPSLLSRYGNESDSPSEEEPRTQPPAERRSSLTKLGNKITALIMPKTPTPSPSVQSPLVAEPVAAPTVEMRPRMARPTRGPWLWVALVLVLVGLLALLASLVLQPAVDAAPVGTGDSWTTIQQLLWPYTGLRHNGQPPV